MTQRTQEKTVDSAIATSCPVDLAPPFYSPWGWYKTYPKQGFWSAHRHYDHRGELVLQVGRQGGSGSTEAKNAYLRYMGSTPPRFYTARFDAGPLTRIPNNAGIVGLKAFMQVNGYRIERDLVPRRSTFIGIGAQGWHVLHVGVIVRLECAGTYGEAICTVSDVNQYDGYSATAVSSLAEAGEPSLADLQAELEKTEGPTEIFELGTLKEVAEAGLPAEG